MRRRAAAAFAAALLLLAAPIEARAHAGLLSSSPAAGDTLREAPRRLALRFSEPVELSSSGVSLLTWDGRTIPLPLGRDGGDVATLAADAPPLEPGGYRVRWRTLSADGHPVDGSFVFYVAGAVPSTAQAPPDAAPERAAAPGIPLLASVLRGLGVGALSALAGLLLLMVIPPAPADARVRRLALGLSVAAPVLLAAHALAWAAYARGGHGDAPLQHLLFETASGHVEMVRAALALLALWALALARRPGLALGFALAAVAISGITGHAAAIHPTGAVPAKALHVAALAVWLGGLGALASTASTGEAYRSLAIRASSLSLGAVGVLVVSGVIQTLVFVPSLPRLAASAYGAVILAKLIGLGALVAMGARNRYRLVPRLPADDARASLRRTVRWELGVMALVLLAAGLLAYVPVPRPPTDAAHPTHRTTT